MDYQIINSSTLRDSYPTPIMEEVMNRMGLKPTEYKIEKVVYWSTPERCFIITQVYAEVCLVHAPLGA